MTFLPKGFAAAAGSAAILALAAGFVPAGAQETPQPPAASEVDDAQLKAFAQASLDVEQVIATWSPRIQESDDAEQAEELRNSANQEIVEAVQENGLEIETYNQIYQLAQADPQVATSIQRYREEMQ